MGQIKNIKLHIVTDIKCRRQTTHSHTMILYKDIFTNFDVFTDVYKMDLEHDLYWNVHGKYIVEDSSIDDSLIGGNASEEATEAGDDAEANKVIIPDIVAASNLQECVAVCSKSDFKEYMKKYAMNLIKKVGEKDAERAKFLKENLNDKFMKPLLADFKKLRLYAAAGDEFDNEGGMVFLKPECADGEESEGTKCTAMILKDSVWEEKC